jgi:hypothetical protein
MALRKRSSSNRGQLRGLMNSVTWRAIGDLKDSSRDGAIHYIFMDWRHLHQLLGAALPLYSEWKNLLVWSKANAGQGSFYRSKHELVAVFKSGNGPHINNFGLGARGRYRTNVLDYPAARHAAIAQLVQLLCSARKVGERRPERMQRPRWQRRTRSHRPHHFE